MCSFPVSRPSGEDTHSADRRLFGAPLAAHEVSSPRALEVLLGFPAHGIAWQSAQHAMSPAWHAVPVDSLRGKARSAGCALVGALLAAHGLHQLVQPRRAGAGAPGRPARARARARRRRRRRQVGRVLLPARRARELARRGRRFARAPCAPITSTSKKGILMELQTCKKEDTLVFLQN